jgi:hypothetical protein
MSAIGTVLWQGFVEQEIHHNSYDLDRCPNLFLNSPFEKILKICLQLNVIRWSN